MTAEQALHQKFSAVQEVLEDIEAGSATWDDFRPVFSELRALLRQVDSSLWAKALMTIENAEDAVRRQKLEQVRGAITQARAQIGSTQ